LRDNVEFAGTQVVREDEMREYSAEMERQMKWFYRSLSEKDRRRYAAVEAEKLGFGGVEYVSRLLECDPKTIRQGREDLQQPEEPVPDRVRKKGVAPNG
jgi:hypothetical protein